MIEWLPDTELPGYEQFTIPLPEAPTYAFEQPGSLVATVVRRNPPSGDRAVLYVHGWNDYFFQTHLADSLTADGFDFHALELRRYGRSLREGHLAGYIAAMEDYFVELDLAMDLLREAGYREIVLMGHSTGGLVAALYAHERPGAFSALVLNSPWIELQGSPVIRPAAQPVFRAMSAVAPTTVLVAYETSNYARSICVELEGEWAYNLALKGNQAFGVRIGWLRAVMAGHARVEQGLAIDCPVLVLTSAHSDFSRKWHEGLMTADVVLNVDRIAARVHQLGRHVTLVRIEGAVHDIVLSAAPVREIFFDEVERFLAAYSRVPEAAEEPRAEDLGAEESAAEDVSEGVGDESRSD
ncbi:MAG TPA: alpha/beta hydrolase [Arachnia sp.]|nr:alpha/beta hydrolase [Arachnia sp.]HMT86101.1 alpha/beta hydrolase [Arachnia sp.]